jgi:hypothetical protein
MIQIFKPNFVDKYSKSDVLSQPSPNIKTLEPEFEQVLNKTFKKNLSQNPTKL